MESTIKEPSSLTKLTIYVRSHLPAVIVITLSIILGIVISVTASPSQFINAMVTGGMWALLAAGLALVFGVMNIVHFAHGESFMIGAYVGYFVFTSLSNYLDKNPNSLLQLLAPNIGVIAAFFIGALVGVLLEKILFSPLRKRTKSGWVMNTFLVTVGLSFILTNGTMLVLGANFRGIPRYYDVPPLEFLGVRVSIDRLWAFALALIILALLTYFLQFTRTGRAIRAVSQDEVGAQMMGINLNIINTLTLALATGTAAMAGAALLFMFQAYPTVGLKPLYIAWYVVMLVGLGNVYGAIIGGFIVALLQSATQQYVGIAWEMVVPTIVMILVLILAPSGIFGSEVKGVHEQ